MKARKSPSPLSDRELVALIAKYPHVLGAKVVAGSAVVTAAWVRLKCQFGCDGFGQCLVCPPYTPTPEQMRTVLDCYQRAVLVHFDDLADIKAAVAKMERQVFLAGFWKAFGLGAGPCYFCKVCNLEAKECRHSELARPAMEACGIDVFTTARNAGFPIDVIRTRRQCPNYYGLILVD